MGRLIAILEMPPTPAPLPQKGEGFRNAVPEILDRPDVGNTRGAGGWIVTVFDNDKNTVDEVMVILMIATGCTADEAQMETWEVHNLGQSVVHHGGKEECEEIAATIREIGIRVTVTEE